MRTMSPYRLQIFIQDTEMREAMREVAHREKTSLQQLTVALWLTKLEEYSEYCELANRLRQEEG